MRVACPFCGERGAAEFAYRGDARPARPGPGADADAWTGYVYLRDNPAGELEELWRHAGGCGAWLVVTRCTRTHAISAVRAARDVAMGRADA